MGETEEVSLNCTKWGIISEQNDCYAATSYSTPDCN